MITSLRVILLTVLGLAGCDRATVILEQPETPTPAPSPVSPELEREHELVRESVRRYAAALSSRDPAAATETVVRETFDLYEELRVLAATAPRARLEALDLMTVMLVLQIRVRFGRSELDVVDGRGLFERAVAAGLVGAQVDDVSLDEVWIDEAGAHAEVRMQGDPIVWLRKQDEQWRIDIPAMIQMLGPAIESLARERVLTDGKLRTALALIVLGSEESVDVDVLDGPRE